MLIFSVSFQILTKLVDDCFRRDDVTHDQMPEGEGNASNSIYIGRKAKGKATTTQRGHHFSKSFTISESMMCICTIKLEITDMVGSTLILHEGLKPRRSVTEKYMHKLNFVRSSVYLLVRRPRHFQAHTHARRAFWKDDAHRYVVLRRLPDFLTYVEIQSQPKKKEKKRPTLGLLSATLLVIFVVKRRALLLLVCT